MAADAEAQRRREKGSAAANHLQRRRHGDDIDGDDIDGDGDDGDDDGDIDNDSSNCNGDHSC